MIDPVSVSIGAAFLLIGIVTFIVMKIGKSRSTRRLAIRRWQLDTIGIVLSEQKAAGCDFDDLKSRYVRAADAHKEFDIPRMYRQDSEIRSALSDLQSRGIVVQDTNGTYRMRQEETKLEINEKHSKLDERMETTLSALIAELTAQAKQQESLATSDRGNTTAFQQAGAPT